MTGPPLSETSEAPPQRLSPLVEVMATLLAAVLVAAAGWLGWWQLDAWQARRTAEARDLTRLDPVPMTDVLGSDDPFPAPDVGRPVEVAGDWLPAAAFWVSDREHEGSDGFWQVVPLEVSGPDAGGSDVSGPGTPAVLVVTGWSPSTDAPVPQGKGEVTGWLQPPEGRLVTDPDPGDDVFPQIRVADAVQRVEGDLYSAYVVVDHQRSPTTAPSLQPAALDSLPEAGRFTALRNLLYALEWWVFAAFAAFVWWRWRRDAHEVAEAQEVAEVAEASEAAALGEASAADR